MACFESVADVSSRVLAILVLLVGSLLTGQANAELQIAEFQIDAGTVRIVLEDAEASASAFSLQRSAGLGQESWAHLPQATFSAIGETGYLFPLPFANADREFFRAIASFSGTALDTDETIILFSALHVSGQLLSGD